MKLLNVFRRRLSAAAAVAMATMITLALAAGAPSPALAADAATFEAAFEAANAARKAAAAVGHEWRDTKKMLRQAKKLAEKGEYEKAIELAGQAKRQGELGVLQAEEQAVAWKDMVVK